MQAALSRFHAADTQVLGVSVDSVYSHANWGRSLGGVSFPLLSDFEPKGAVARSFGQYLEDKGITDRATVIIDKQGNVRYSVSVTPAGARDVEALVAECEEINGITTGKTVGNALPSGTALFVKSNCGPSRSTLLAVDNLGLDDTIAIRNISEDAAARAEMAEVGGKEQAPCLIMEGKAIYEAPDIVRLLADRVAPTL